MDPLTVSAVAAVVNKFLGEAAAEAGKSTWAGLVRLVRSAFPDRPAVAQAARQLAPGSGTAPDQAAVIDLSAELVSLARADAGFEGALREWLGGAQSLSVTTGTTTNVISGKVGGNAVQGRDMGPISFG